MIGLFIRNSDKFRQSMINASKGLRKAQIRTQKESSALMVVNAKRLAPIFTGETVRGIRRRRISRKGYRVESTVSGEFKQNLFSNQKSPFRTLQFKSKGGSFYYAPNQTVIYGKTAVNRRGTPIHWSGTPRWFDRAAQLVQKKYGSFAVRNTNNALRTAIR